MSEPHVALLRRAGAPEWDRLGRVTDALRAVGVNAVHVEYDEKIVDQVRALLLKTRGVLVWVNPIHEGKNREELDTLLRDVASFGTWVATHPDTIDKLGVKDVVYKTRHLGWGSDVDAYDTPEQFHVLFPARVRRGPRVLKPSRGNGGQRVLKVERTADPERVVVLQAVRGSAPETLTWSELFTRCDRHFLHGALIDQAFDSRVGEGMVRCYLAADRVIGFATQRVSQLNPAGPDTPKVMYPRDQEAFAALRRRVEEEWCPQMMSTLALRRHELPFLWDADFFGMPDVGPHVLCEINASCVLPFPDDAPHEVARLVVERLDAAKDYAVR